jgi:hypothetical protein
VTWGTAIRVDLRNNTHLRLDFKFGCEKSNFFLVHICRGIDDLEIIVHKHIEYEKSEQHRDIHARYLQFLLTFW